MICKNIKLFVSFILVITFFISCEYFYGDETVTQVDKTKTEIKKKDLPEETFESKIWNILIYMSADNNLESAALDDLYEMECSRLNTKEVSIFVLVDRSVAYDSSNKNWSGTRLYKIKTDRKSDEKNLISEEIDCPELGLEIGKEVELDMSSGYVLSRFISFIREKYPSDCTGFIMWGHGTGWRNSEEELHKGFAYDETSKTYMTLKQLGNALKEGLEGRKLDFIGFDTCFGGELEIMYELRKYAHFAVGSEGLVMASGWNYTNLFNDFQKCNEKTPENLCLCTVSQFKKQYENTNRASIAAINLRKIEEFFKIFDGMSAYAADLVNNKDIRNQILGRLYTDKDRQSELYSYGVEKSDIYIDVASYIEILDSTFGRSVANWKEQFYETEKELYLDRWTSDCGKGGLGVYFSTLTVSNLLSTVYPATYISEKTYDQIDFVRDCKGYVPSLSGDNSFLDKLFYTKF